MLKWFGSMESKEYSELIKRITKTEARLDSLEMENETLRNKVLRKIQQKRDEIMQEEQPKNTNTPFTGMSPRW